MKTVIEVEVRVQQNGISMSWPRIAITKEDIESLAIKKAKDLYSSPEDKTFEVYQILSVNFSDF